MSDRNVLPCILTGIGTIFVTVGVLWYYAVSYTHLDVYKRQGRKASRQGSEQRRQAILDAAMRLIVRDGVRAVRHLSLIHL